MLHQMASDINKLTRQLDLNFAATVWKTQLVRQATSCRKLFEDGYLPPIHGKTITSPTSHVTRQLRCGLFEAKHSQHGDRLVRALFCGSMANVSRCLAIPPSQRLTDIIFSSGRRKERVLVR
jgi:hypothetical protein